MTSMEEQKPKKRRSLRNSTKENEDSKPRILTKRLRRCSLTLESSKESGRKVGPKRRVPPSMDVGGKAARFYDADVSGQGASGVAVRQPLKRSPIKTKFLKFKYPQ